MSRAVLRAICVLVPYVPCALRALVPYVPRTLHALVPYVLFALGPRVLHALCQPCFRVSRVFRAGIPHVSCVSRVLGLLVPRTLCALALLVPHLLQMFQA